MWRGELCSDDTSPSELDLAGMYALHLRSLHQKCSGSPHFRMDPSYGVLLPPLAVPTWSTTWHFVSSPFQHNNLDYKSPGNMSIQRNGEHSPDPRFSHSMQGSDQGHLLQYEASAEGNNEAVHPSTHARNLSTDISGFFTKSPSLVAKYNGAINGNQGGVIQSNNAVDELTEMSNTLLGQQFLGMDRVISLDDTDFVLNFDVW